MASAPCAVFKTSANSMHMGHVFREVCGAATLQQQAQSMKGLCLHGIAQYSVLCNCKLACAALGSDVEAMHAPTAALLISRANLFQFSLLSEFALSSMTSRAACKVISLTFYMFFMQPYGQQQVL